MNTPCWIPLLESALSGELSAADEATLHRHLEECESCAAALERMAGEPGFCRDAAALLTEDELDAEVPIRNDWSDIDFTVEHLEPSDEPGVLGRLGEYDVLEIIGRGGMGIVLKGFDRQLNRCVAIKVLTPHLAQSPLARKRFTREAQAAAAVIHPNVMAIHNVQPAGRLPYFVMPLVAGESLAQRIAAKGQLELKETLRIGMQAAAALSAAHEQGLVHRDVKPANILLEKGVERAVLTDFGLARAADDAALTRWGVIAGTPQYMSPEQARGEPLDGRSDLFSMGSVLYEMATGVSPFRADSAMATMRRLVDDPPQAMASLNAELPPWFVGIVERLLEKDPARRFNSAKEVSELLEGCLAHLQQPANVPLPVALLRDINPKRKRGYAASAVSLIAHASGYHKHPTILKGVLAMTAVLGVALGLMMLSADPPDITGQWKSDDWGQVVLKKANDNEYTGTYSNDVGQQDRLKPTGEIRLKWSRIVRRFNGTWREGNDRFGDISVHLVGDEIRGALTTDPESKLSPDTPPLADLTWTRAAAAKRSTVTYTGPSAVVGPEPPRNPAESGDRHSPRYWALQFDGESGCVTTNYVQKAVTAYTVAAWVKTTSAAYRVALISDRGKDIDSPGNSLTLGMGVTGTEFGKSGDVFFCLCSNGVEVGKISKATIDDGKWHHVAGTWTASSGKAVDSSQFQLYIDGVQLTGDKVISDDFGPTQESPLSGQDGTQIGYDASWQKYFQGTMDDLLIFERALDQKQVAAIYKGSAYFGAIGPAPEDGPAARESRQLGSKPDDDRAVSGLAAGYHFDEGSGKTARDFSGHGHDGTLHGGVEWVSGRGAVSEPPSAGSSDALHFDHGHVDFGDKQLTTGATSISVWYHCEGHTDQWPMLLDLKAGSLSAMFIGLNTMGNPGIGRQTVTFANRGNVGRINAFETTPFTPTAWTHLVCTYDGSDPYDVRSYAIYVNGRSLGLSPTIVHGGTTAQNNLGYDSCSFGRGTGPKYFIGSLAEVLLYDMVLSADEAATLYRAGGSLGNRKFYPQADHLVAAYHFNEGRGTTVHDFSGHGNDGTMHDGATWVSGGEAAVSNFSGGPAQGTEIANSVEDFSGTQGKKNWYYGYYSGKLNPSTFKQFPTYDPDFAKDVADGNTFLGTGGWGLKWGVGGYWATLVAKGGHPNGDDGNGGRRPLTIWPARRWESTINGTITISGSLNAYGGGKMFAGIFVDDKQVFWEQAPSGTFAEREREDDDSLRQGPRRPLLIWEPAPSSGTSYSLSANVSIGSHVDFVIAPNGSDVTCGATMFTGVISVPNAVSSSVAGKNTFVISTDASWKATASRPNAGWNKEADFDDRGWDAASTFAAPAAEFASSSDFPNPMTVIWDGSFVTGTGPGEAWFRKKFVIKGPVQSADYLGSFDDYGSVWINGNQVISSEPKGAYTFRLDARPYLHEGTNLIAIHGVDLKPTGHSVGALLTISTKGSGRESAAAAAETLEDLKARLREATGADWHWYTMPRDSAPRGLLWINLRTSSGGLRHYEILAASPADRVGKPPAEHGAMLLEVIATDGRYTVVSQPGFEPETAAKILAALGMTLSKELSKDAEQRRLKESAALWLDFRCAPARSSSQEDQKPLPLAHGPTADEIESYLKLFAEKGPNGGRQRGDPYFWLGVMGCCEFSPLLYTRTDRDITAMTRYSADPGDSYVLLSDKPDEVFLSGSKRPRPWHLKQVRAVQDGQGRPAVELQFDDVAAAGMARLTQANRGRALATLFSGNVLQIQVIDAEIRDKMLLSGKAFDEKLVKQIVRSLSECMLAQNEPEQVRPK